MSPFKEPDAESPISGQNDPVAHPPVVIHQSELSEISVLAQKCATVISIDAFVGEKNEIAVAQRIADQRSELTEHRTFDVTVSCFVDRLIEETDSLDGFLKQYVTRKWRRTKRDNEAFDVARTGLRERVALDAMLAGYFDYRCTVSEKQPIWRDFPEKADYRKIAPEKYKDLLKMGRALRVRGMALIEAIGALRPAGSPIDTLLRQLQLQSQPVQRLAVPARRRARTVSKIVKPGPTHEYEIQNISHFILREASIRRKLKTVLHDSAIRLSALSAMEVKKALATMEVQLKDRNDLALDVKIYKDERDGIAQLQEKYDNSAKTVDRYSRANMRMALEDAKRTHAIRRRNLVLRIERTAVVDVDAINQLMLADPDRCG